MGDAADKASEERAKRPAAPSPRRAALRFAALFSVCVLSLLTGYRYAINSEANMWYLFKVAQHTTALLNVIGDAAEVQPGRNVYASGKRAAELAAWRDGAEPEPRPPTDYTDEAPLSPWDEWLYQAYSKLRRGESLADFGPTVHFVKTVGLIPRMADVRAEIARLESDIEMNASKKQKAVKRLKSELKELNKENKSLDPAGNRSDAIRNGRRFRFMVVPDCGALPSLSIFAGAVLAFPVSWRKRFIGLLTGLPVLYCVNILRLTTLAYIGAVDTSTSNKWFSFSHEYVWQGIFVLFVVAAWMAWIELVVRWKRV